MAVAHSSAELIIALFNSDCYRVTIMKRRKERRAPTQLRSVNKLHSSIRAERIIMGLRSSRLRTLGGEEVQGRKTRCKGGKGRVQRERLTLREVIKPRAQPANTRGHRNFRSVRSSSSRVAVPPEGSRAFLRASSS